MKNDSRYINADKEYGPGSDFWQATSGATGLIAGILGGNIQGGVAAGAAPYMAKLVKDATGENEAARIALHGIVSAALAEVQGGNGLAAAAGAMASAALMGNTLAKAFYGKDVKDLDGEQRAFISNLATAVGAAAGGSVGGDTFSAASGANAARVEVENNSLSKEDEKRLGLRTMEPIDINPLFNRTAKILDGDGEPLKGGGSGKPTINKGQQNKHIEGTNEYKTAAASSGSQRSILTVDPQSLLPRLGTGQQVGKVEVGLAGSKERIDFGKPIGNFIDKDSGLSVPTTKGIVHYGKDGAHIVPARP